MGDLSEHFSRREFRCGDGCGYARAEQGLLDALERLRAIVKRPLPIVSGSRCVAWNAHVGGHPRSQHLHGRAADIPGDYATARQARDAGFHGVGVRRGRVVHVDVTPGRSFFLFED